MERDLQLLGEERSDKGSHRVLVPRAAAVLLQAALQDGGGGEGRVTPERTGERETGEGGGPKKKKSLTRTKLL